MARRILKSPRIVSPFPLTCLSSLRKSVQISASLPITHSVFFFVELLYGLFILSLPPMVASVVTFPLVQLAMPYLKQLSFVSFSLVGCTSRSSLMAFSIPFGSCDPPKQPSWNIFLLYTMHHLHSTFLFGVAPGIGGTLLTSTSRLRLLPTWFEHLPSEKRKATYG